MNTIEAGQAAAALLGATIGALNAASQADHINPSHIRDLEGYVGRLMGVVNNAVVSLEEARD